MDDFQRAYADKRSFYERLGENVVSSLKDLLDDSGVAFLDVGARVKEMDSACEKVERKKYANPLIEMEDLCGVRVICYYPGDVDKIVEIIRKEFWVQSEENAARRLGPQEFGYRSTHLIVKIKAEWLHAPTFRGLDEYKAEVQVRTVLMHAWAEIQHKLAYKSQEQIPDEFQRRLYRLSAKFEEADEQFDHLRHDLQRYRRKALVDSKKKPLADLAVNLDTLQEFLRISYPEYKNSSNYAASFLAEIHEFNLNFEDLTLAVNAQKPYIGSIESAFGKKMTRVGMMRNALDIYNDRYFESRLEMRKIPGWYEAVKIGRKGLGKQV